MVQERRWLKGKSDYGPNTNSLLIIRRVLGLAFVLVLLSLSSLHLRQKSSWKRINKVPPLGKIWPITFLFVCLFLFFWKAVTIIGLTYSFCCTIKAELNRCNCMAFKSKIFISNPLPKKGCCSFSLQVRTRNTN